MRDVVAGDESKLLLVVGVIDAVEAQIAVFVLVHDGKRFVEEQREQNPHRPPVHRNQDRAFPGAGEDQVQDRFLPGAYLRGTFAFFAGRGHFPVLPRLDEVTVITLIYVVRQPTFATAPTDFVQAPRDFPRERLSR